MRKLGLHEDNSTRYLVNFFQFEWSPYLSDKARTRENFQKYDIKTVTGDVLGGPLRDF
jgi:hypothetical protein